MGYIADSDLLERSGVARESRLHYFANNTSYD